MNLTFTLSEELANEIVSCLSNLIQTVQEETNISLNEFVDTI